MNLNGLSGIPLYTLNSLISQCPALESLSLGGCSQCTDETIEILGRVAAPNIRYLNLSGCHKLKGNGSSLIFFLFSLFSYLFLFSSAGLFVNAIFKMKNLRALLLSGCEDVKYSSLQYLAISCPVTVEYLDLSSLGVGKIT
jgi:hypothetical protein